MSNLDPEREQHADEIGEPDQRKEPAPPPLSPHPLLPSIWLDPPIWSNFTHQSPPTFAVPFPGDTRPDQQSISSLLTNAAHLMAKKCYAEASAVYTRVISSQEQPDWVWRELATCSFEQQHVDEALARLEQALVMYPESVILNKRIRDYRIYVEFDQEVKLHPEDAEAWLRKAAHLQDIVSWDLALATVEEALTLHPRSLKLWQTKSYYLYSRSRYEEALAACEYALALDAHDPTTRHWNVRSLLELQRFQEALAACERFLSDQSDDEEIWYQKGLALSKLGKVKAASAAWQHTNKERLHQAAQAGINGATLLCSLGRFQEALPKLNEITKCYSPYSEGWYQKGLCLLGLGRFSASLQALERAIVLEADHKAAWYHKGVCLSGLKRYRKAFAAFDQALVLDRNNTRAPANTLIWYHKGVRLYRAKQYAEVLAAFYQVEVEETGQSQIGHEDFLLLKRLKGFSLLELGRYQEALDTLNETSGNDKELWHKKGRCLQQLGRREEALAAFAHAKSQPEEDPFVQHYTLLWKTHSIYKSLPYVDCIPHVRSARFLRGGKKA